MSSATEPESQTLTDDDVVAYLRADRDFFQRHSSLLSELNLPHDSGQAVSLIERQVAILRERNMQMRRRMNELLRAAKDNDELFAKTRTLTLELLNVHNWHELNEVLATYMLADFQADFVCAHLLNLPVHLDHLASHDSEPPYDRFVRTTTFRRSKSPRLVMPAPRYPDQSRPPRTTTFLRSTSPFALMSRTRLLRSPCRIGLPRFDIAPAMIKRLLIAVDPRQVPRTMSFAPDPAARTAGWSRENVAPVS